MADQKADNSILESLSALVDNQATELELHRLLKQSETDPELRVTWERYQLSSAVLRGELPGGEYTDLSSRIMTAIDAEPAYEAVASPPSLNDKKSQAPSRWWQTAGRFAVAASVAGAVVLGAQQYNTAIPATGIAAGGVAANNGDSANRNLASQPVPLPAGFNAPMLSARTVSSHDRYQPSSSSSRQVIFVPRTGGEKSLPSKAIQNHLNELMLEHAGHAALNSGRGMMPFARVARMEEE